MDEKTADGASTPATPESAGGGTAGVQGARKPRRVGVRLVPSSPDEAGTAQQSKPVPRVRPIQPGGDGAPARPRIRVKPQDLARLRTPEQGLVASAPPVQPPTPADPLPHAEHGHSMAIPDLGMKLVYVPSGQFEMGSTDGASDETPVRDVRITCGFWLGAYPVLQREYRYIMGRNPSRKQALRCPVENVSWLDAERFCAELTDREYQALRLPAGYEYRLPTEAEWEYAARGGPAAGIDVFAGSTSVGKVAWYKENSGGRTHLAGTKQPNELGLHDMSGNVWEWCWDWYRADAYGDEHAVDPVCAKESGGRVIRGGSWLSPSGATRVATRNGCWPYTPDSDTGFRVCLGPRLDTVLARSTRELPCGGSETRPNRAP